MSWEKKFIESIQIAARKAIPLMVTQGSVTSVDKDARTCNVNRDEMPELINVRLNAILEAGDNVLTVYPKVGSKVICVLIENNPTDAYVITTTDLDEIKGQIGDMKFRWDSSGYIFNDGSLGGMVKAGELKIQSEKDKSIIDAIMTIVTGSPIPEPGNGSASAFQAAMATALQGKQSGEWDNLENEKVKH